MIIALVRVLCKFVVEVDDELLGYPNA